MALNLKSSKAMLRTALHIAQRCLLLTLVLASVLFTGCSPSSDYICTVVFGGEGSNDGNLKQPLDVATDREGRIFIADTANNRIQVFTPDGNLSFKFGKMGQGKGYFRSPCGIYVDDKSNIWVADTLNNRIQKFDPKGRHVSTIEPSRDSSLHNPKDVAVNSKGQIFVVDSYNNRICKFDPIGQYVSSFGTEGKEPGQFRKPDGIYIDRNDKFYIVDTRNMRVQVLDADENFLFEIKEKGKYGMLLGPSKVTVDNEGNIYIVDCGQIPLVKYSSTGQFLTRIGELGKGQKGKMTLPAGVSVLNDSRLAVVDRFLCTVQLFEKK
ncbi:MAG: hypothetical protein CVV64_03750 [Candidatus Wallbacteria bacterium HGW-Wallbacteria-1]|jgi:DNA-binding beta-propeller fold protein YncE|uniref:6-bladed beta-propeller n=1 Tax=Candidatus Wallbacteria bacterium HGW-Wallbacteria-1 TaxID=2013854 RepID=A0A2N1PTY1_9BACT|nr:MAG: hypothetical protein CVV64_03750 [Candidatus Wallbacteria bacterium HGW-Wallbacteria-1]